MRSAVAPESELEAPRAQEPGVDQQRNRAPQLELQIQPNIRRKTPLERRAILIMVAVILGTASNQIAWNIVGVALPRMQGAYSATPDQISWVMSSFVLGNTLMFVMTGWLACRLGRRRVFLTSIILFTITLIMCATAQTLTEQVFWRFMQGLTSAALIPLGHAIVTDAYPRDRFGEATAVWSIGLVVSSAAAPLMGAYLIHHSGWPSIFYFMIPISLLSLIAAWKFIPESKSSEVRNMDWIGVTSLLVLVTCVHLVLNRGNRLDWLESPEILIELILAGVGMYYFVVHCVISKNPFIPLPLLRDLNFVLGTVLGFFQGGLVMLSLVIMPLLLEGLIGYTVLDTGMLILPRGAGVIVGMILNAKLSDRVDPRVLFGIGFLIIAAAGYMMSTWNLDVGQQSISLVNFALGVGGGISFVPLSILAFATVKKEHENEGFAIFYLVYYTGVTSGIAIVLSVISRYAQINYSELANNVTPFNENFKFTLSNQLWDITKTTDLAALSNEIIKQANMIAYTNGFWLTMICAIVAVPLVLMFQRKIS